MKHMSPESGAADFDDMAESGHRESLMQIAITLVEQLKANNIDEANQTIYQLCKRRESDLFQEIGKLTRDLHETLNSFSQDEKFETLMHERLPDAKKRLDYVVQLTEESAHKTLTIVEQCLPLTGNLAEQAQFLYAELQADKNDALQKVRNKKVENFLLQTVKESKQLAGYLTDVLMAQSYQDLTGQVIHRVIKLVQDVENSLVSMIKTCGTGVEESSVWLKNSPDKPSNHGYGPAVPGVAQTGKQSNKRLEPADVVQSQDEVDDLLSTLGF